MFIVVNHKSHISLNGEVQTLVCFLFSVVPLSVLCMHVESMYRNTSPGIIITLVWKDVRGVHVCVGGGGVERDAHPILWKCWNSRRSDSQLNKHQSSSTLPPPTLRSKTPCTSYSTLIPHSERQTEKRRERDTKGVRDREKERSLLSSLSVSHSHGPWR